MKVAEVVAGTLADLGLTQVFTVTGGGAMHLNDAIGRESRLRKMYCHHEQACAMAAESFARLSGRPAVVCVTSGPGGINTLNGVFGAFVDSVPMVIISGQVKRETLVTSYDLPLRQLGDQEANIISIARSVCKMAVQLRDEADARYVVEKAVWLSTHGRPGPVWIDIPIDVQAAPVDPSILNRFRGEIEGSGLLPSSEQKPLTGSDLVDELRKMTVGLSKSKRPVVLVGAGVRQSGAHADFLEFAERLNIPVVTGWNAHDVIWNDHPLFVGRPGTVGDRAGNFAVQNSDFLLVLGSRLNIRQIGYDFQSFARSAHITMIDIDRAELMKPTLSIGQAIHADLRESLKILCAMTIESNVDHAHYLDWCIERKEKYPVVLTEYQENCESINPYVFVERLFELLEEGDVIVAADGTACVVTFQAAFLRRNQRLFTNSGCASMGYDLPAAIGASLASGLGKRIICLAGDGSIMMNIQELQTITGNDLPIKIFVLRNDGYSSIRQTQENYFPDNIVGCGPESGLSFPDFVKIGRAFDIHSSGVSKLNDLDAAIQAHLKYEGPSLLEVNLDPNQPFSPKLSSRQLEDGSMVSSPLEDLAPFLERDELASNMLIPIAGDSG